MENEIAAPRAATVAEIRVQPGQAVEAGEVLARIVEGGIARRRCGVRSAVRICCG